ncbi:MAG: molybdopterin-dependent oxidoreductase [Gammaproteobacteria bacterium]|nr:molybdopterin-dependent oxidoreductase [Gammaproteobacteria bacterium]
MTGARSVKTTCPYCGVGCGIAAAVQTDGSVQISGDETHPANFGRLCSKGAALGETIDMEGRLLYPEIAGGRCTWDTAIDSVAHGFARVIQEHGPDAVAFYVSGQLLTEDYYVANKLMKGFIGSANIDTNSRLCMASSVAGHKRAFGSDTVPCCYEDLELADLIVLTGSNAAWCHPVLFQRIAQAKKSNPRLKIVVIDPRRTATCDIADLHLALRSGSDVALFNGLLSYLHMNGRRNDAYINAHTEGVEAAVNSALASAPGADAAALQCGLDATQVQMFFDLFASTEKTVTVYSQGVNQSSSGTDKVNAIINCHLLTGRIGRPGMGPFSFTGQPNAMGGREVGGLANQLAAHMELENPEHRARAQRFWQSPVIADKPGLKAVDMFHALGEEKIKAIWIMATNPVVSLPDADAARKALQSCEFVVVSDCVRHTDTTACADVLLPALAWGEKDGTVTNSERRISLQRKFLPIPGEARPDWWIIAQVAKCMGYTRAFNYSSPAQIFNEHAALSGFENNSARDFDISGLCGLDDAAYQQLQPVQWPITQPGATGIQRLFGAGRFYTPSGKARFIPVTPREPHHPADQAYPMVLNTGRVRDHWHTLTRTGKSARLSSHTYEPYAELHPQDAEPLGIRQHDLVNVISQLGSVTLRALVNDAQQPGNVFVPMHWNDQSAGRARVDALVHPVVDPVSGQPESKHTPVRVSVYRPRWHGFLLSRRKLALRDVSYWARAKGAELWRYELAGETQSDDWSAWARALLCASKDSEDDRVAWIDYLDRGAGCYRGARLLNQRLESCLFVAPSPDLPSRSWLMELFTLKRVLTPAERNSLLAARPLTAMEDAGATVCACFNVGRNTLIRAIQHDGLHSVEAIGRSLKAGTNCGSCIPELRSLIAQTVKQCA